jgi:hypothetical protein
VLHSDLKWIGPRLASVVSLNAARCLTQRRSDLQVLKPLVGCLADRQGLARRRDCAGQRNRAAGMRRGRTPKPGGAERRWTNCLQKRHCQVPRLALPVRLVLASEGRP